MRDNGTLAERIRSLHIACKREEIWPLTFRIGLAAGLHLGREKSLGNVILEGEIETLLDNSSRR
jgi:hypothetical protein